MRFIVIDPLAMTYSVYVGRKLVAQYQADQLLDAGQVERLRTECIQAMGNQ